MSATTSPTVIGIKPNSIKIEPWSEFPKQSYSIHSEQFCHQKPFVAKFQAYGSRSTLNIKETVNSMDNKLNVEDDVKLWFNLTNTLSLYARVKSTNYLKVHLDHGLFDWAGTSWNIYSSFWTDKQFSKSSLRLGVASIHPKCTSDTRLRVNKAPIRPHFFLYNRTIALYNQTKFGLIAVYDLNNNVLQKNSLLLGQVVRDRHEVFLRLQDIGFRNTNPDFSDVKSLWDAVTINYVGRLNQTTKVGIQASMSLKNNEPKHIEAVVQTIIPEQSIILKAKINSKSDVAFLFKRAFWGLEDLLTVSAGFGINNAISDKRLPLYGLQLDFNI